MAYIGMERIVVEILPEKQGVTKVRFSTKLSGLASRDAMDTLMNIIMGKFPKRAGYVSSTTVILEAVTDKEAYSKNKN